MDNIVLIQVDFSTNSSIKNGFFHGKLYAGASRPSSHVEREGFD
jgi:hypothetical protein